LIWFDAHGDFNTWETTPSGFLGGMPLAMLVGRGEQSIADSLGLAPLSESRVLLADGRDLDPGEKTALESSKVHQLPDIADLLTHPLPEGPIWVHFDTDMVDAAASPAQNYPVTGGPSVDELREAFRRLARTGQVCAVSLSAWNPALPGAGISAAVSMSLLGELAAVPC
jgi:arginase